ncbi:MAG: uroporphyrinogen-III C-methyltransferase [Deltaproteobacteria bacterium]|nr:uroporphyrinogen-III C-methyltransferase [Deltaproteobacteria bacterium]
MEANVSLVGAGPGDPTLFTLAGVRALKRANVVLYDALVNVAILQHASPSAEKIFVGKRAGHEGITQDQIHTLIERHVLAGQIVCRLKGGDPLLFGRGSEEAEFLVGRGISFEIVPGVSSVLGATAYAGIPLTHRSLSSSVAFITSSEHASKAESAHDWRMLACATQTLVLFMGLRKVRSEMARLVDNGRAPNTPAAAISRGTFSDQQVVVATVATLADACDREALAAPALIIVGEVVNLRSSLRWWDQQPLHGVGVLVTRPEQSSESLVNLLTERGAKTYRFAATQIASLADSESLVIQTCLNSLAEYDAVAFTSPNTVRYFFEELRKLNRDARALANARLFAVGETTAACLSGFGLLADGVGDAGDSGLAEIIVRAFDGRADPPRVLIPRGSLGRMELQWALEAAQCLVSAPLVYRTVKTHGTDEELRALFTSGSIDVVTFFAPSAVQSLCVSLGPDFATLLAPCTIAVIGETTGSAVQELGLRTDLLASTPSEIALIEVLEGHYRSVRVR